MVLLGTEHKQILGWLSVLLGAKGRVPRFRGQHRGAAQDPRGCEALLKTAGREAPRDVVTKDVADCPTRRPRNSD